MYGITKKLHCWFFIFGFAAITFAQNVDKLHNEGIDTFGNFDKLHRNGQLNDTIYIRKIDSLASVLLNQGVFYSIREMAENLIHYEEVAWGNPNYGRYRQMYYLMLLNNAYMSDLWGASVYYAEKFAKESAKSNTPRPLIELVVATNIYGQNGRHKKVIEAYEKEKTYFDNLLLRIKEKPGEAFEESLDALELLGGVINAYATQRDTIKVEETYQLAKAVAKNARSEPSVSNNNKFSVSFTSLSLDFFRESFYQNFDQAQNILNKIATLKKKEIGQSLSYADYSYLE